MHRKAKPLDGPKYFYGMMAEFSGASCNHIRDGTMTLDEINALIAAGENESRYLEFKRAAALPEKTTDGFRTELSKDVSSFANSAGGRIIYGVAENPLSLNPIDRKLFPPERLEQLIAGNIAPRIPDLRIHVIQCEGEKVLYEVEIPQGKTAHQAFDKRYYKRYERTIQAMEDYEIRDVMARGSGIETSLLLVPDVTRSYSKNKNTETYRSGRHFQVRVTNKGTKVSNWCVAEISAEAHAIRANASRHYFTNEGEEIREVFSFSNAGKPIEEDIEEKIVPAAYPDPPTTSRPRVRMDNLTRRGPLRAQTKPSQNLDSSSSRYPLLESLLRRRKTLIRAILAEGACTKIRRGVQGPALIQNRAIAPEPWSGTGEASVAMPFISGICTRGPENCP